MIAPLLLVVIGLVVWAVLSRRRDSAVVRGAHTARNVVQYGFLLTALFTAAAGITRLVGTALPAEALAGRRAEDVALGLSLTIVAAPAWVLLWRVVARRLADDPSERASTSWALYVSAAATVSLVTALVQAVQVGRWLVGVRDYRPGAVAAATVWGGVWAAHAWLAGSRRLRPSSPVAQVMVLAGSAAGLIALVLGSVMLLRFGFGEVYRALVGGELVAGATADDLRDGLVVAGLATPVWWWHWLRRGMSSTRTVAWHVYVMLVAALGGLLTAVTFAGIALFAVAQWFFGTPDVARLAVHFDVLPDTLAGALGGTWAWWYHRSVLAAGAEPRRTEPGRAYEHLGAAVGLLAGAAGLAVTVMAALQALTPGALATADPGGRDTLALALTILALGVPLWLAFWCRMQARVHAGDVAEVRSPSRRVYLLGLLALAGMTGAVSLAVILFVVFRDLLDGNLSASVLLDLRVAIGLVVAAGAVAAYHLTVHRADRRLAPPAAHVQRRDVLLVSPDGQDLAAAVASGTGATVRRLHRLDTPAATVDTDRVTAAVLASPYPHVVVTVEADGEVHVIPFERV